MSTMTDTNGKRWANACALCGGARRLPSVFRGEPQPECPWCKAVRMKYGNYWYPITKSNEHLFEATGEPQP
jgi:hypothetical protein